MVTKAIWNNNYWIRSPYKADKIFVHIMVAVNWTAVRCGQFFKGAGVSSNYGIGYKGDRCQYVEEKYGAYCQGSKYWNQRGISIELANDSSKWTVSDDTLDSCIELVADIAIRNNFGKVNYTGDLKGNLCKHMWVANTGCPDSYVSSKFPYIAKEANKLIDGEVRVHARGYYKKGDSGRGVKLIQKFLKKQGLYKGGTKGNYKLLTVKAVKKFQKKYGLAVDGLWGEECLKQYNRIKKG